MRLTRVWGRPGSSPLRPGPHPSKDPAARPPVAKRSALSRAFIIAGPAAVVVAIGFLLSHSATPTTTPATTPLSTSSPTPAATSYDPAATESYGENAP